MKSISISPAVQRGIYALCSFFFVLAGSLLIREKTFDNDYPYLRIGGDASAYIAMAEGSAESVAAPFRYRVIFPMIASIFDAPATAVFRLINKASLFFFYLIAFLICDHRKIPSAISVTAVAFVFLSPWHLYIYQNPFITDGLVQLMMIVMLYAVTKKQLWLFAATAAAGVFTHERILFLLPLWFMVHNKKQGTTILLAVVILYAGMRITVENGIGAIAQDLPSGIALFNSPFLLTKDAIIGSAPLYIVALTGLLMMSRDEMIAVRPIVAVYGAAAFIPALVATDTGRMLIGFSPAAIVLSAYFFSTGRFSSWNSGILFFSLLIALAYLPVTIVPIAEWLFYRKYVIAGSFVMLCICYGKSIVPFISIIKSTAAKFFR